MMDKAIEKAELADVLAILSEGKTVPIDMFAMRGKNVPGFKKTVFLIGHPSHKVIVSRHEFNKPEHYSCQVLSFRLPVPDSTRLGEPRVEIYEQIQNSIAEEQWINTLFSPEAMWLDECVEKEYESDRFRFGLSFNDALQYHHYLTEYLKRRLK